MAMTPALKAMVEAVHADLLRQVGRTSPGATEHGYVGDLLDETSGGTTLDGSFDLERAMRAGLAAIEPTPEMALAMHAAVKHQFDLNEAYARVWRAGRDAILKETP